MPVTRTSWSRGMAKVPGSGRKLGSVDKRTRLKLDRHRSAIQQLTEDPSLDPLAFQIEMISLMRRVQRMRSRRSPTYTQEAETRLDAQALAIDGLAAEDGEYCRRWMDSATAAMARLMNYVYPRLANIDQRGETVIPNQQNIQLIERVIVDANGNGNGAKVVDGTTGRDTA